MNSGWWTAERFLNFLMKYYNYIKEKLNREPEEFELHLFSATYSEHCGYLHSRELLKLLPRNGAVFYNENAGGIKVGKHAVLFKMESHNHPCAVEPFNGAATGIGGIVRDVLAMNARPIALCNSLKFGDDKGIIEGVVDGISNYGNCIGVPTVSTEVLYNKRFTENPLVNVTAIGIAKFDEILTSSNAKNGQYLLLAGSATMKDGMGGASFASKKLSDEKKENKLSIQIANPFMKKKLLEACLEIFSRKLVAACQDCGAAGILSSTSEVAFKSGTGVDIDISKVHTGDATIKDFEIMLSETQERMLFVVDAHAIKEIEKILDSYELEYSVIGKVTDSGHYLVRNGEKILADIPVSILVTPPAVNIDFTELPINDPPLKDINSPYIYNQYDHTVGTRTQYQPDECPQFNSLYLWEEKCSLGIYTFSSTVKDCRTSILNAGEFLKQKGFTPKGITNCLNFTNPEIPPTISEFRKTIFAIKEACEKLQIPVCSGNVSFYNESSSSKIINIPAFTMLGIR